MADTDTKKIENGIQSIRETLTGKLTHDSKAIVGADMPEFSAVQSPIYTSKPRKNEDSELDEELKKKLLKMDDELRVALESEINQSKVEYQTQKQRIIIEYPEASSFRSGSADLSPSMKRATHKLAFILENKDVRIVVAGYTDDIPIKNDRFRSNWDLSAARAASIAHELTEYVAFAPEMIEVVGHGEGYPKVSNDTPENRAINRRVEVMIEPVSASYAKKKINFADSTGFKMGERK